MLDARIVSYIFLSVSLDLSTHCFMNKRKLLIVNDNIITRQHILSVAQNMKLDIEAAENTA